MSRVSYNNIKKYAAFIFMVFTVLSGSSEVADTDSFVKIGKKAFFDILATNKLFIHDAKLSIGQSRIDVREKNSEGFRTFVDAVAEISNLSYIQLFTLPLTILILFINNRILKSSIWRSAVF